MGEKTHDFKIFVDDKEVKRGSNVIKPVSLQKTLYLKPFCCYFILN